MKFIKNIISILLVGITSSVLAQTIYTVNQSQLNNSWDGATLSGSLEQVMTYAIADAESGIGNDVVINFNVSGGTTMVQINDVLPVVNITKGSIIFQKDPSATGNQGIQYIGTAPASSVRGIVVSNSGTSQIKFKGLQIWGFIDTDAVGNTRTGIEIKNGINVEVGGSVSDKCFFRNNGIFCYSTGTDLNNIQILNNDFNVLSDQNNQGIIIEASNVALDILISENTFYNGPNDHGIYTEYLTDCTGDVAVTNNTFSNLGQGIRWFGPPSVIAVNGNHFSNNGSGLRLKNSLYSTNFNNNTFENNSIAIISDPAPLGVSGLALVNTNVLSYSLENENNNFISNSSPIAIEFLDGNLSEKAEIIGYTIPATVSIRGASPVIVRDCRITAGTQDLPITLWNKDGTNGNHNIMAPDMYCAYSDLGLNSLYVSLMFPPNLVNFNGDFAVDFYLSNSNGDLLDYLGHYDFTDNTQQQHDVALVVPDASIIPSGARIAATLTSLGDGTLLPMGTSEASYIKVNEYCRIIKITGNACVGDNMTFGSFYTPAGATYNWEIFDGSGSIYTSSAYPLVYSFTDIGTYTVELTISRADYPDVVGTSPPVIIEGCGICINNLFQNGDLETHTGDPSASDDQDIDLAEGFSAIWPSGSLADYFAFDDPPASSGFSVPSPASGNYAGFWLSNHMFDNTLYREGLFNTFSTAITANTGNYTFTFDLACLYKDNDDAVVELGVYGIYNPSSSLGAQPTEQFIPQSMDLFPSNTVLLQTIEINNNLLSCDGVKQEVSVTIPTYGLPIPSVTNIMLIHSDQVIPYNAGGGKRYIAVDDFCLDASVGLCEEPDIEIISSGNCLYTNQTIGASCYNESSTYTWQVLDSESNELHTTNQFSFDYTFYVAGTYTITLTVSDPAFSEDVVLTETIIAEDCGECPEELIAPDIEVCENTSVQLSSYLYNSTAFTYLWDLGNGVTSTLAQPSHVFTENTTISLQVTLISDPTCVVSDTAQITVISGGDCAFDCPNNLFQNGDLETFTGDPSVSDDQDIDLAEGFSAIWPTGSLADYFAFDDPPAGTGFNIPSPASGNYAGFWLSNHMFDNTLYREGLFNTFLTEIPANTGNYTFTFDLACLYKDNDYSVVELGVYGIYNPSSSLGVQPSEQFTPQSMDLFPGNTVLLQTIEINNDLLSCDGVKQEVSVTIPTYGLSIPSVTNIMLIHSGQMIPYNSGNDSGGKRYVAVDNFCLDASVGLCEEPDIEIISSGNCLYTNQTIGASCYNESSTYAWQVLDSEGSEVHTTNQFSFDYTFYTAGAYTIILTVSDDSFSEDVVLIETFIAEDCGDCPVELIVPDINVCVNQSIQLSSYLYNSTAFTYLWDLGNGVTSTLAQPSHVFTENTTISLQVTLISDSTCVVSDTAQVTVTSGGNCDDCNASVNLNVTPANCTCDGVVVAIPVGTTGNVDYSWQGDLSTTNTLTGVCSGDVVNVTVVDELGCTGSQSITVSGTGIVLIPSINQATCSVSQDGSISITATNGTPSYTYLWDDENESTTSSISGLNPGNYNVTVTDADGCVTVGNYIILNTSGGDCCDIDLSASTQHADCTCNGAIDLTVTNYNGSLTYLWSTPQSPSYATIQDISNLCGGQVYTVVVTDGYECTESLSVNVNTNFTVMATPSNASCGTSCDGSISLNPQGGTAPYTYLWNTGATTSSITGLCSGTTYSVTITDAAGCIIETSYSIGFENEDCCDLSVSITAVNISCNNPGSASVNISNGTAPYTIEWSTGSNETVITNLEEGTYSVTVTDAEDCVEIASASIVDDCPPCENCITSFSPLHGHKYVVTAWVKQANAEHLITYDLPNISLFFTGVFIELAPFYGEGQIIDGWQRIEGIFEIPDLAEEIIVRLNNQGNSDVFFDDIRIHPFSSNMKTFVYDPIHLRVMAEGDENNYSTFYEYDEEGALIRIKKETERGVMTIKENRNNIQKQQ